MILSLFLDRHSPYPPNIIVTYFFLILLRSRNEKDRSLMKIISNELFRDIKIAAGSFTLSVSPRNDTQ